MQPITGLTSLKPAITFSLVKTLVGAAPSKEMLAQLSGMGGMANNLGSLTQGSKLTLTIVRRLTTPYKSVTSENTIKRIMK